MALLRRRASTDAKCKGAGVISTGFFPKGSVIESLELLPHTAWR
jgi:hypothetical protein